MQSEEILKAPWTPEQVDALNRYQQSQFVHPYTCGSRDDEAHDRYAGEHSQHDTGILVATPEGWRCPVCDYTQDSAFRMSLQPDLFGDAPAQALGYDVVGRQPHKRRQKT
jgi:hypothetical protein